MGKALADSVGAWTAHQFSDSGNHKTEEESREREKERQGKEEILEEAAGVLKDILQELDTRIDERAELDEDEARVIGLTLLKLSDYILPMKCVCEDPPSLNSWSDTFLHFAEIPMATPSSFQLTNRMTPLPQS